MWGENRLGLEIRTEVFITGTILIVVGLALAGLGYNKLQPSKAERTARFIKELAEEVSGEKSPDLPRGDRTGATVMVILGGASFFAGLGMILKSGQRKVAGAFPSERETQGVKYCPNCGGQISGMYEFCPNCGQNMT